MKKFFFVEFTTFLFGLLSIIKPIYFWQFFLIYLALNIVLSFVSKKVLMNIILSIFLYPYFPIIHFFTIDKTKTHYISQDFEFSPIETATPSFKSIDLAPFYSILKYGDNNQKKEAVRLIFDLTSKEKIDFIEGIKLLYDTISLESNQDVILYATESINSLEKLLLKKLSEIKDKNKYEYAKYLYYYANSPFLEKEQKIEILKQAKNVLETFLEKYPLNIQAIILLTKILEKLNEKKKIEKLLTEKLTKLKVPELFEHAIIYYLKNRNHQKVKELTKEFYSYNYTFKNNGLKTLLEG